MAFRVGQKVVCVDDSPTSIKGRRDLVAREVYTIRWVGQYQYPPGHPLYGGAPYIGVLIEEVRRPERWGEVAFRATRFRPLVSKSTDTGFSILEDIRKRESVPADERVRDSVTAGKQAEGA